MYDPPSWQIIPGSIPVLLVAAHNFPHERLGKIKSRDVDTGLLAMELAKKTGAWVICTTNIQPDPNWYSDSPFRLAIKQLISSHNFKVVIDIHGRRLDYPHLLEYFANPAYLSLYSHLLTFGRLGSFAGKDRVTITEDLQALSLPALELEIRRDGRDPAHPSYAPVFTHLRDIIQNHSR